MIFITRSRHIVITALMMMKVVVVVTATRPNPITFLIFLMFNLCLCLLLLPLLLLFVCVCECKIFAIWTSDTICNQYLIYNIWHQCTGLMNMSQHITQRDIWLCLGFYSTTSTDNTIMTHFNIQVFSGAH